MDIVGFNRAAWDREVEDENPFTRPVSPEAIAQARQGNWNLFLTETKPVPRQWFPDLGHCRVLCLAAGGGQQGPILAAAGAQSVTVFDLSPKQLAQDRFVAERDGLVLSTIEGDMSDLSAFADRSFDLVVHPISNLFIPEVNTLWAEVSRVLSPGGLLLAAFMNPMQYIFNLHRLDTEGRFEVKHPIPFSSVSDLTAEARGQYFGANAPIEFSHTLEDQIGGQLRAGLMLTDFYEDHRIDDLIGKFMPSSFATRAIKP